MKNNDSFSFFLSIVISVLGILPLAYLGLITPHVKTAFLIGLSDMLFVVIIGINIFMLGYKRGKNGY